MRIQTTHVGFVRTQGCPEGERGFEAHRPDRFHRDLSRPCPRAGQQLLTARHLRKPVRSHGSSGTMSPNTMRIFCMRIRTIHVGFEDTLASAHT